MALTEQAKARLRTNVQTKFGASFPSALIDIYIDAFIANNQDANEAIIAMRQSTEYQTSFPGNINPDGVSVKYSESEYLNLVDAYKRKIESIGLNSDLILTQDRIETLITNVVSNVEFGKRINQVYQQVVTAIPEVKQFYQETFGKTLTDAEIIASAIDPQISQDLQTGAITGADIISQNILRAEIGGEALLAGVDIDVQQAEQLRQQGLSRQQARQGFQAAPSFLAMARRQGRTGVSATDVVEATQLGIQEQQVRLGRIAGQSEQESAARLGAARARTGEVVGLQEQ